MLDIQGIRYLTYKEATNRLDVSKDTIAVWVSRGKITGYSFGFGREKYVRESEIDAMGKLLPLDISAQKQNTTIEDRLTQVERQLEKLLSGNKVYAGR